MDSGSQTDSNMAASNSMSGPPHKKIKTSQEILDLINECFDLMFNKAKKSPEDEEKLRNGCDRIRETLEQISASNEFSFGENLTSSKINWGKCLGLMLEGAPETYKSLEILTGILNAGPGLL